MVLSPLVMGTTAEYITYSLESAMTDRPCHASLRFLLSPLCTEDGLVRVLCPIRSANGSANTKSHARTRDTIQERKKRKKQQSATNALCQCGVLRDVVICALATVHFA